jgi:hypothetical protein
MKVVIDQLHREYGVPLNKCEECLNAMGYSLPHAAAYYAASNMRVNVPEGEEREAWNRRYANNFPASPLPKEEAKATV